MKADIAKKDEFIRVQVINTRLFDSLIDHGAQCKLAPAATAFLKTHWKFDVAADLSVAVTTPDGPMDIDVAITRWLGGDAGSAFLGNKPKARPGYFSRNS